jgi:hypothetical protein
MPLGTEIKDSERSGIRRTNGENKKLVGIELSIEERAVVTKALGNTTKWISEMQFINLWT